MTWKNLKAEAERLGVKDSDEIFVSQCDIPHNYSNCGLELKEQEKNRWWLHHVSIPWTEMYAATHQETER